jgi:hypothetical protein
VTWRDLGRRLTASTEVLHRDHLREDWSERAGTPIADVVPRTWVRTGGEVQGVQVVPRAGSPSLEVSVDDGTGRAVAVFTGRAGLGGMTPGRKTLLEGMVVLRGRRLEMLNPTYTLLP